MTTRHLATPAGELMLGSIGGQLCLCDWTASRRLDANLRRIGDKTVAGDSPILQQAVQELEEYFAGRRRTFSVPLLLNGTCFQKAVWQALTAIPYGETESYGHLAARLGCPRAVRAVANANASNAISIFIPCHRVIGTDGSLTGYSGGLHAKRLLRDIEMKVTGQKLF